VPPVGQRDHLLGRQQRLGDVLKLRAALVTLVAAGLLASCGGDEPADSAAEDDVVAQPVTPSPIPEEETPEALPTEEPEATPKPRKRAPATPAAILSASDRASFQDLAASLGGQSGLAVSGVGLGKRVERVGALRGGSAWSTAKVPIAMAVIDAGGQAAQQADLAQAITASDNAAATRLWDSLGPPEAAAAAVDAQLRAAGDTRTSIESRELLASYSAFGQTGWSLRDQAKFAAGMPCTAAGEQVLGLMGQVVEGQRWGLGATGQDARFKGGWGPGSRPGIGGDFLDRQLGIVTVDGTPLAVSIATVPADGTHESGMRNLTEIARWLTEHAQPVAPSC
jgi:hypothetical protein